MEHITVKTTANQKDSFAVRKAVFIEEQGYENEFDEIDNICDYVTVYYDGQLAGTGRFFPSDEEGTFAFGRIAVLREFRNRHLGAIILSELEKAARARGGKCAVLLSQEYAIGFYEKSGFSLCDTKVVYDEGQPHRRMKKFF